MTPMKLHEIEWRIRLLSHAARSYLRPTSMDVQRVALERLQRHDRERLLVSGSEHNRRCDACFKGLAPSPRAYAPAISGLESRETHLRNRRRQVVAVLAGIGEKLR